MSSYKRVLELLRKLKLPEQSQSTLSFCDGGRVSDVDKWTRKLTATQVNRTSVLLYKALPEVGRLKSSPSDRLEMLEHLRPYVQGSIEGLSQSFLNQPLSLPEGPMKAAIIAQALQKYMSNGYCQVLTDTLLSKPDGKLKKRDLANITQALHRTMTGMGWQLLRSAQLYTKPSAQMWLEMHTLFQVAQLLELGQKNCIDDLLSKHKITIQELYFRNLLLASARPNQLRQQTVLELFKTLPIWAKIIHLEPHTKESENLLVVNLNRSEAPIYQAQLTEKSLKKEAEAIFGINLDQLLEEIQIPPQSAEGQALVKIPKAVKNIIDHLLSCWGQHHQRRHQRSMTQENLEITVGLSNIHYHITEGMEFKTFLLPPDHLFGSNLQQPKRNKRFEAQDTNDTKDPWHDSFDAPGIKQPMGLDLSFDNAELSKPADTSRQYPIYKITIQDSSPGGYCLNWQEQIPNQVKTGELIGIREPGRRQWSVAVVRWVRQVKTGSQTGVEIVATQVQPMAIKLLSKTGEDSDFMRALLATPIKAINQPQTLLTAAVPFRVHNKVALNNHGSETIAQLTKQLMNSASASQFSFREFSPPEPDNSIADNFSSQW